MDNRDNRAKGRAYEDKAAEFLTEHGFLILERNYLRKTGEIDIIARDTDGTTVFIEVKYRKSAKKGQPYEAVTAGKQQKIYRTAQWYLKEKGLPFTTRCRFDVVSILNTDVTLIKNAFGGL